MIEVLWNEANRRNWLTFDGVETCQLLERLLFYCQLFISGQKNNLAIIITN